MTEDVVICNWDPNYRDWAINHWSKVLFKGKSRLCLSRADGGTCVWRRPGERYSDAAVIQRDRWSGQSVMIWGGIFARIRTELIVVPGNLTGIRYREILGPVAVAFVRRHKLVFQQDNARPHTARVATTFLQQHNVDTLPRPSFPPDMSPIEHLWDTDSGSPCQFACSTTKHHCCNAGSTHGRAGSHPTAGY